MNITLASAISPVSKNFHAQELRGYLNFNDIEYRFIDINNYGNAFVYELDTWGTHNILFVDFEIFPALMQNDWNNAVELFSKFCKNQNKICIWNDVDGLLGLLSTTEKFRQLDNSIDPGSIVFILDGDLVTDFVPFNNIELVSMPLNWFFQVPRIPGAVVDKMSDSKDFLLTMIKKPTAPHRDVLWAEINSRLNLIDKGMTSYQDTARKSWIGTIPPNTNWIDGIPSMDLYRRAWVEIVPETLHKSGLFITEKLIKPIMTKTPFLVLSTPGYLNYVKKFGFKTFENLIDESYDNEPDLHCRTKQIVDNLECIINMGSKQFYNQCLPILEYNQRHLIQTVGQRRQIMDRFMTHLIEEKLAL